MKKPSLPKVLLAVALAGLSQSAQAFVFGEAPQINYWHPVSPHGTYVYATSFVAPVSGNVTGLGTWLNDMGYTDTSTQLKFEILGSVGGNPVNGPTVGTVLASTAYLNGFSGPTSFTSLTAGSTYWFAINGIGGAGTASYQVSSANDDMHDGGFFWYSNDSTGANFDGRGLRPEMAFKVTVDERHSVPDSGASALLLGVSVLGLAALRKKMVA